MKRILSTVLLALLAALLALATWCCVPFPAPLPPGSGPSILGTLTVHVCEGPCTNDVKVPGATVTLRDGTAVPIVIITDGAGNASGSLLPGVWRVEVTAEGFRPWTATIVLPAGGSVAHDAALERDRPRQVRGRIQAQGRALVYPDGSPFHWLGATAFGLVEQLAHGREAEAVAFLRWARSNGFNIVRTLAMCSWLPLTPAEGVAALPRLLALAEAEDLHVEVVALSDTAQLAVDIPAHVAAVGRICAEHDACAGVEVANEAYHASHVSALHSAAYVEALGAYIPAGVLWAASASADDEALVPGGRYIVRHLDRSRDDWNQVRRVRELENVSAATGRYVVNDEPMGFGEQRFVARPDGSHYERWTDPALAFTFGVLGRIMDVGSTFHFEDGLRAKVPGPVQQAAAEAFIAGATLVPDDLRLSFRNAEWPDSPVRTADWTQVVRVYSGIVGARGWTVALGLSGDPRIEWRWSSQRVVAERPGVTVYEIGR